MLAAARRKLIVFFGDYRSIFQASVASRGAELGNLRVNDPTGMAVVAICMASPYTRPMLDSFLKAGGAAAVVRVLRESKCPVTLSYIVNLLIELLVDNGTGPEQLEMCQRLADKVHESGESGVPGFFRVRKMGEVHARNMLIRAGSGKYMQFS
jgi:hypothetical protein